ncbi:hypothetical protein [Flavobacterium limnophilum]|uniref:hypothetical protein n=1 Tax=Flavobacterium limnophilum TaxID=3003262 RepID=UPI002482D01C|nr:hypothetical protein [Flavobacterium limnophilum]
MKHNWQQTFKDFPEIPPEKRWQENSLMSTEQEIAMKFLNQQHISKKEEETFKEILQFYKVLNEKLQSLDYTSLSDVERELFKGYILYAFNYLPIISNNLTIFTTYRMVINESVLDNNERITNSKYLKHPTLEIVQKTRRYNRANSTNTTAFYSSESIDTNLKELRPPLNKLITIGVWRPKSNRKFLSYAISHGKEAIKNNVGVAKATKAFEELKPYNSPLFIEYIENYFNLLGREFSKTVSHHSEYLMSSTFSELILHGKGSDINFECIIYPSVGNNFKTDNIAMRTDVFENDFYLEKVIEFEVTEAFYDDPSIADEADEITLADVTKVSITTEIDKDGNIKW